MRKVVIAVDSFKGCLRSVEVAGAVERGVLAVFPDCGVDKLPVADGGEGTVEALIEALGGEWAGAQVHDPLLRPITARYGVVDGGRTAVIEMAAASGLPLLAPGERDPLRASTAGTGELIADALRRGCRKILVGIGGSATNDGGIGMLAALGFRFRDASGRAMDAVGGEALVRIDSIDAQGRLRELADAEIVVACDVSNPFYGPQGAARVFGPQKRADNDAVETLDRGMRHFAEAIGRHNGMDVQRMPGSGAAGGLGGAFAALLGARLVPGAEMILDALGFEARLRGADLVITGEGRLDAQSVMGKAPGAIAAAAARAGVPVIAVAGAVEDAATLNGHGFGAVFPIQPRPVSLQEAMQPAFALQNIERTVRQAMLAIKTGRDYGNPGPGKR